MIACILLGLEDAAEGIEARLNIRSGAKHADTIRWLIHEKLVDPTAPISKKNSTVDPLTTLLLKTRKRDTAFDYITNVVRDVDWDFLRRACVRGNKGSKALSERIVKWAFEDIDMEADFGVIENSRKLPERLQNMGA